MKSHYYARHAVELKAELNRVIPRDQLRALHRKSAVRHFLVAFRQLVIVALTIWGLVRIEHPMVWLPLAFVLGFTLFDFTILLHEVLHNNVFECPRPRASRALGLVYGTLSGLSASGFTRWHLDHHAELGSDLDDPKRSHLSPKVNTRRRKLLYCTPVLFFIYFRASRRESATYSAELQRRMTIESAVAFALHLATIVAIWYVAGSGAALRAGVIPGFFIAPIAFTLNRLGQHYDIDPGDPAKWGTLMKGHWFWDLVYLNSNYHVEHHFFPGVPFYRLPALQRALTPFYEQQGMRWTTYRQLIYGWFVENRAAHTNWRSPSLPERWTS